MDKVKKIHLIGIKGVGMTALAHFLNDRGFVLSGSDVKEDFITKESLDLLDIPIVEFSKSESFIKNADLVVSSSAYNKKNNQDFYLADELKKRILYYPQALAHFFNNAKIKVAVAGTHGKTTTTAMLTSILKDAKKNVTAILGSKPINWNANFCIQRGFDGDEVFVIEADEYKNALLNYKPDILIITNIDYDHPDVFKTKDEYYNLFLTYVESLPKNTKVIFVENSVKNFFPKKLQDKLIFAEKIDFPLKVIGNHNILNASLAYKAALMLGVSKISAERSLKRFSGTSRRQELLFKSNDVLVFDDYAHHPEEIKQTVLAVKEKFQDYKLVAIFQPHTYSRTEKMISQFKDSLSLSDFSYILPIYFSARERKDEQKENILKKIEDKNISFMPKTKDLFLKLNSHKDSKVVYLFMGAGDIRKFAESFIKASLNA